MKLKTLLFIPLALSCVGLALFVFSKETIKKEGISSVTLALDRLFGEGAWSAQEISFELSTRSFVAREFSVNLRGVKLIPEPLLTKILAASSQPSSNLLATRPQEITQIQEELKKASEPFAISKLYAQTLTITKPLSPKALSSLARQSDWREGAPVTLFQGLTLKGIRFYFLGANSPLKIVNIEDLTFQFGELTAPFAQNAPGDLGFFKSLKFSQISLKDLTFRAILQPQNLRLKSVTLKSPQVLSNLLDRLDLYALLESLTTIQGQSYDLNYQSDFFKLHILRSIFSGPLMDIQTPPTQRRLPHNRPEKREDFHGVQIDISPHKLSTGETPEETLRLTLNLQKLTLIGGELLEIIGVGEDYFFKQKDLENILLSEILTAPLTLRSLKIEEALLERHYGTSIQTVFEPVFQVALAEITGPFTRGTLALNHTVTLSQARLPKLAFFGENNFPETQDNPSSFDLSYSLHYTPENDTLSLSELSLSEPNLGTFKLSTTWRGFSENFFAELGLTPKSSLKDLLNSSLWEELAFVSLEGSLLDTGALNFLFKFLEPPYNRKEYLANALLPWGLSMIDTYVLNAPAILEKISFFVHTPESFNIVVNSAEPLTLGRINNEAVLPFVWKNGTPTLSDLAPILELLSIFVQINGKTLPVTWRLTPVAFDRDLNPTEWRNDGLGEIQIED